MVDLIAGGPDVVDAVALDDPRRVVRAPGALQGVEGSGEQLEADEGEKRERKASRPAARAEGGGGVVHVCWGARNAA